MFCSDPPVIDAEIKQRVLRAHGKLIHVAIWARPDLAHCVSVIGRYVHNLSQKHLDAYLRVAHYLIKTKDLRIVYGMHDTQGLVLNGFSDSDWGADPDSYRSTGAYIFFLDGAACSWIYIYILPPVPQVHGPLLNPEIPNS